MLRFARNQCRLLSFFSNAGKQTKPICLPGKGRSGLGGKALIRCRPLVGGSNLRVLFCLKNHSGRMQLAPKLRLKGRAGDLSGDDHFADWPERETSEFHMRPGERDTYNGYCQHDRGDEVAERQPPTCENKP